MFRIDNDGARIVATTYWSTPHARAGLVYCSVNAGTVRLLVPHGSQGDELRRETSSATRAAVQLAGALDVGRVHIVWGGGPLVPASPYAITIDVRQCDRSLPMTEAGRWVPLAIYGIGTGVDDVRLVRTWPALIRRATVTPDPTPIPEPPRDRR
jgi:hypothetical protein